MPQVEKALDLASSALEKTIKKKMLDRDVSQMDLARLIGVNRSSISLAISGSTAPKAKEIRKKIYRLLGMDGD